MYGNVFNGSLKTYLTKSNPKRRERKEGDVLKNMKNYVIKLKHKVHHEINCIQNFKEMYGNVFNGSLKTYLTKSNPKRRERKEGNVLKNMKNYVIKLKHKVHHEINCIQNFKEMYGNVFNGSPKTYLT